MLYNFLYVIYRIMTMLILINYERKKVKNNKFKYFKDSSNILLYQPFL